MEFVIAIVALVALCLCLGVDLSVIMLGVIGLLGLVMSAITVFFIACGVMLIGSERKSASFVRIDKNPKGRYEAPYYLVDGAELASFFPAEIVLRNLFYRKGKKANVRICRGRGLLFDRYALITVIVGIILGGLSAVFIFASFVNLFNLNFG